MSDRTKAREQARNVEHYLDLWTTYPTKDNWHRLVDSVHAYRPERPHRGSYDLSARGDLLRCTSVSWWSGLPTYAWQRFRKDTRDWSPAA